EVPALLLRHLADDTAGDRLAEHGELSLVDADGAVLARVVDADHPLEGLVRGGIAGEARGGHAALSLRMWPSPKPVTASKPSEITTFQPARDRPASVQCTSSQRT